MKGTLATGLLLIALAAAAVPAAGQKWTAPQTPWGHPDLQGLWTNATVTPFERPAELADKPVLTEQEAAEFEKRFAQARDADRRVGAGTDADVALAYNQFWYDRGTKVVGSRRTSLVMDPPDGKVPAFGMYVSGDYQFAQRWFGGVRYDHSDRSYDSSLVDKGSSFVLTYWPSEFSQIRGQYRHTRYAEGVTANELLFQFLFSIGAHGAHTF